MPTSICPECTEDVFVDADADQGTVVTCDECGTRLVVVGLDPLELDVNDDRETDALDEEDEFDGYD